MSKVFIFNLDKPLLDAVGFLLSKTIVGSKKSDDEEAIDSSESNTDGTAETSNKKGPVYYQIFGTLSPKGSENEYESCRPYNQPSWIKGIATNHEEVKKELLDSDIIVCDLLQNLKDTKFAIEFLNESKESYSERPKTFICISSLLTWAKTKIDSEDPDATLLEEDFRKRRAHPNFKDHLDVEKTVIKCGKKGPLKTYVIASGLVYHGGPSIFHFFLKLAWQGASELPLFGDGTNQLPMIHLQDLSSIVVNVVESHPEMHYVVAIDDSKLSLQDITKCISENLGTGQITKVSKEDALLFKDLSQMYYDMLLVNIKIEAGIIKEFNFEWKSEMGFVENISTIINEYRDYWGLWPVKVLVHGPPASGKTFFSQRIAKEYKIHHLQLDKIMSDAVANLEKLISKPQKDDDGSTEDEQRESSRELLEEYRNALLKNNQVYPPEYVTRFVKEKLRSMPCKNQGYVLDGFPTTLEETTAIFQASVEEEEQKEEAGALPYDKQTTPEFVINLEASDDFIKNRVMKLPEKEIQGTQNEEKALLARLEAFRKINNDDTTVLNYYDEREIHPLVLSVDKENVSVDEIMGSIKKFIGKPHNYGPTPEEITAAKRQEDEENARLAKVAEEEKVQREKEETERQQKAVSDWNNRLEDIRKQEREVLEAQSVPLRQYLMKNVMPTLTSALIEVCKVRPEDPIDYLAEYLFKVTNDLQN